MKTFSHLWQYLAEFFLEWEMFQTKVVEKVKVHVLFPVTLFWKSCRFWDNVKKYCGATEAADDGMAVYWLIFHSNSGFAKARLCYVIGTLRILFGLYFSLEVREMETIVPE